MHLLKIVLTFTLMLSGTISMAAFHEAYDTVAICKPKDQVEWSRFRVIDSTSSNRAVLELHKTEVPGQEQQMPVQIEGWKDNSVRDPIVWQYEFKGYELFISLERREDGLYAATLTHLSNNGERKTKHWFCEMM